MMNMFDMTDLGELKYFLGLEIVQNKTGIFMSQKKYIEDTLKKFNMSGCKMASTPMNLNEKFSVNDETEMANAIVYRSLIGRLIYLTHSRPDISYAVGVLSRFMHKPSKHHLGAARRILRYLGGSKEYGIWFRKDEKFCLKGYTDSDWAGSVDDRRSTSGHCFLIGTAAVSWSSKKQATVALSSTEAEYVAATTSACQAVWLRRLLSDLGEEQEHATTILCDSRSAVQLSRNPWMQALTRLMAERGIMDRPAERTADNGQQSPYTRLAKLEFPKFSGDDVKALLWHTQFLKSQGGFVTWEDYKQAILARFGTVTDDPMSELKNLKYETTSRAYEYAFDDLLSRIEISENHAISLFIGGLPVEIAMAVRMFKPRKLADAYCLTNLQEAIINAVKKKGRMLYNGSTSGNARFNAQGNNIHKPLLPNPHTTTELAPKNNRKQLTQKEYQEKRANNQCFY
ncbi:retrovirus-related pol polyprotein from transposon TNT 1-94 [Tanacetum coccineum]